MVSNKEIKQRLNDKSEGILSAGYLICNQCEGYYQLQEGESPEDFSNCECGGKLKHFKTLDNNTLENICPKCGTTSPSNADFCTQCGYSMNKIEENELKTENTEIQKEKNVKDKWAKKAGALFIGLMFLNVIMLSSSIFNSIFLIGGFVIYVSKSFKVIYAFGIIAIIAGILQIIAALLGKGLLIFAGIFTLAFACAILYTTRKIEKTN